MRKVWLSKSIYYVVKYIAITDYKLISIKKSAITRTEKRIPVYSLSKVSVKMFFQFLNFQP